MIPFILYFSDLWFPKSVDDYKMLTVVYYTLPESTISVIKVLIIVNLDTFHYQ